MRGWKPALAGRMTRQTEEDGLKWSLLKQILKVCGVHAVLEAWMFALYFAVLLVCRRQGVVEASSCVLRLGSRRMWRLSAE